MRGFNNSENSISNIGAELKSMVQTMKFLKILCLLTPILLVFPKLSNGQQAMTLDAETNMIIQEFGVVLTFENSQISVQLVLGSRNNEQSEDQLERGDLIVMMNGKRASDLETLRATFDEIEDGQEIKIGVQRGEERFILEAIKGDMPETPGRMVMDIEAGENGEGITPVIVPEIGAVLADQEGSINVLRAIPPIQPQEIKDASIEGYSITAVNGKDVTSAEEVQSMLADLEVGAEISITFTTDGDEKLITFAKPQSRGNIQLGGGN